MDQIAVPAFVALAMHMGHKGDNELQDEECGRLANSALELGLVTGVHRQQVYDMVDNAAVRYFESETPDNFVARCSERLEEASRINPDLLAQVHAELRKVAEAHHGINADEQKFLDKLATRWSL